MIVAEQFLKSIPKDIKQDVLNKLSKFEQQFLQVEKKIRELPAGYWVRRIKNTDIFKFRLNNKDRILFSFINTREQGKSETIFIKYVTHDDQIREGRSIDTETLNPIELEINMTCYEQESDEKAIEDEVTNWVKDGKLDLNNLAAVVVKDEWLSLLSDETNTDFLYYLSDEQYEVLQNLEQPIVLSGAGGTGKTVVLVNALSLIDAEDKKALYLSYSKLLVEKTEELYHKYLSEKQDQCAFWTMNKFFEQALGQEMDELVTTHSVMAWLEKNMGQYSAIKKKDAYEILGEINGIIKGYLGLEYREVEHVKLSNSTKLSLEQYLDIPTHYSSLDEEEKRATYKLTEAYERWLAKEGKADINDLSRKVIKQYKEKWDWIIVDEVQDLSEVQIYMISQLLKPEGHIIWAGDMNQTINPTFFQFGRINNLYYTYGTPIKNYTLKKNYRSTKANIAFINEMTAIRRKVIGASKYDYEEISIKEGEKPVLLDARSKVVEEVIENVKDKHYCAILVPNQRVKEQLIACYKEAEKRIFMLHEIKGLEYENIFCYNIMSDYAVVWKEILEGKHKNEEHMKYYFNLLYVAASRAKNQLVFCEEEKIDFGAFTKCEYLNQYDEKRFGLTVESTKEDWKKEAIRLEKVGQEEKAKLARDYAYEEIIDDMNRQADQFFSEQYKDVSQDVVVKDVIDELLKPGIIAYRQRKYTEARAIFEAVNVKYPNEAKVYYYLANTYGYMSGGMEYSIRFFEKAIELDPYQYEYYIDMACVLRILRRYKEALKVLERASQIYPDLANAYEVQSTIYNDIGNYKKAMSMYKKAIKHPRCIFDEYNKTWSIPKSKGRMIKVDPNKVTEPEVVTVTRKGLEYLELKSEHYIEQCIEGVTLKSYQYKRNKKTAYIQFDVQKCNACSKKEQCIFSESNTKGNIRISEVELQGIQSSEKKEGKGIFQEAAITINSAKKLIEASQYYNEGRFKEAIDKYKEVIYMINKQENISEEIEQLKIAAYGGVGNSYINLNNLDEAEKYLEPIVEIDHQRCFEPCNSLGVVYMRKQKFEQAIELFERAISYEPLYEQARDNIRQAQYFMSLRDKYSNELSKIVGYQDEIAQKALVAMLLYIDMPTQPDSSDYVYMMYMQSGKAYHNELIYEGKDQERRMGQFLGVPCEHILEQEKTQPFDMRGFARRLFYRVAYMEGLYIFLNKREYRQQLESIKASKEVAQAIFKIAYFAASEREKRCKRLV